MDAFLRRVIDQRERETAALIVDGRVLDSRCHGCRKRLNSLNTHDEPKSRYCVACGGGKRSRREGAELVALEQRRRIITEVLGPFDAPNPVVLEARPLRVFRGETMSENEDVAAGRTCPHCGKKLRSDNTKGVCAKCQSRGRKADGPVAGEPELDEAPEPKRKAKRREAPPEDIEARFTTLAQLMGIDPEVLLARAMQEFLDRVTEALRVGG